MVALIAIGLGMLDIVLYMENCDVLLIGNDLGDLINIRCEGADNTDTRDIA